MHLDKLWLIEYLNQSPVQSHRMCGFIPSKDSFTSPLPPSFFPRMLHYQTLKTTINTHLKEGKVRFRHNLSRRSAYVHIKRLYWKLHPVEYIGCVVVSAFSGEDGCLEPLLQVAVDLEAVVPRVCHRNMTIRCQCQTLRAI